MAFRRGGVKGGGSYFKPGSHNYVCPVTGEQVKIEDTLRRWDGLVVSRGGYDPRPEQSFGKPKPPRYFVTDVSAPASDGSYVDDGADGINEDADVPQYPYLQDERGEFILFSDEQPIEAPFA